VPDSVKLFIPWKFDKDICYKNNQLRIKENLIVKRSPCKFDASPGITPAPVVLNPALRDLYFALRLI